MQDALARADLGPRHSEPQHHLQASSSPNSTTQSHILPRNLIRSIQHVFLDTTPSKPTHLDTYAPKSLPSHPQISDKLATMKPVVSAVNAWTWYALCSSNYHVSILILLILYQHCRVYVRNRHFIHYRRPIQGMMPTTPPYSPRSHPIFSQRRTMQQQYELIYLCSRQIIT